MLLGHDSHTLVAKRLNKATFVINRLDEIFVQLSDSVCHSVKAFDPFNEEYHHDVN